MRLSSSILPALFVASVIAAPVPTPGTVSPFENILSSRSLGFTSDQF
jgi:hypothetical protein